MESVNAQIEAIILTNRGTAIHAKDAKGTLYKFSGCPLVWKCIFPPQVGLRVTLELLEERPYGFKANRVTCN